MREICKSGSVGAPGGKPPGATRRWHAVGGNRGARFNTALCEARETTGCLDVSVACGYLSEAEVLEDLDRLDHIVAVCWRLSRSRK
jgi:hypothetical protein